MNRRHFLKSAAIASVIPVAPVVAAPVNKPIRIFQGFDVTVIVCGKSFECRYPVSSITHEALEATQEFLKGKPDFEYLLDNDWRDKCRYHDEYVQELIAMFPNICHGQLRTALYIYENKLKEIS